VPRFSKILCPIDFEEHALVALEIACDLAVERGGTIHLLHVARIPSEDMNVPLPFDLEPRWERSAKTALQVIARDRLEGKVPYQIHVISGIPDADVARFANQLGADLVVMATHGRKGLKHLVLGSVAEHVMREANCPVITVRPKAAVPAV